jgi:hypothetical protein
MRRRARRHTGNAEHRRIRASGLDAEETANGTAGSWPEQGKQSLLRACQISVISDCSGLPEQL